MRQWVGVLWTAGTSSTSPPKPNTPTSPSLSAARGVDGGVPTNGTIDKEFPSSPFALQPTLINVPVHL
jgi:hypothetical protein